VTDLSVPAAPFYRNRDYLLLVSAQGLSLTGREIESIVLPLLVLGLTGSPAQVGLIVATQSLPYLLFSLAAGALIDRWDRRIVMLAADAVRVAAFASLPIAWAYDALSIAQFYVVAAASGTAFVFYNIAEISCLPQIVRPDELTRATSANTVVEWIGENAGPAIGGILVGLKRSTVVGAMIAYGVQAAMLSLSLLFLGAIRKPLRTPRGEQRHLIAEIREGVGWLLAHRVIRTLAFLAMTLAVIFAPVSLALIVLARDTFHASPAAIGFMFSIGGFAGIMTALAAPWLCTRFAIGQIIVADLALWAIGLALVAIAPSMLLLTMAWLIAPAVSGVQQVVGISYRLSLVPADMQGRVNSVFRFVAWGARPAALAGGGYLIGAYGPRPVLWLAAAGMAVVAAGAFVSPIRAAR
jgi:MFS family permease